MDLLQCIIDLYLGIIVSISDACTLGSCAKRTSIARYAI